MATTITYDTKDFDDTSNNYNRSDAKLNYYHSFSGSGRFGVNGSYSLNDSETSAQDYTAIGYGGDYKQPLFGRAHLDLSGAYFARSYDVSTSNYNRTDAGISLGFPYRSAHRFTFSNKNTLTRYDSSANDSDRYDISGNWSYSFKGGSRLGLSSSYITTKLKNDTARSSVKNILGLTVSRNFSAKLDSRLSASYEKEKYNTSSSTQSNYNSCTLGLDTSYMYKKHLLFDIGVNYRNKKNDDNPDYDEDNLSFAISMNYKL